MICCRTAHHVAGHFIELLRSRVSICWLNFSSGVNAVKLTDSRDIGERAGNAADARQCCKPAVQPPSAQFFLGAPFSPACKGRAMGGSADDKAADLQACDVSDATTCMRIMQIVRAFMFHNDMQRGQKYQNSRHCKKITIQSLRLQQLFLPAQHLEVDGHFTQGTSKYSPERTQRLPTNEIQATFFKRAASKRCGAVARKSRNLESLFSSKCSIHIRFVFFKNNFVPTFTSLLGVQAS